MVVSKGRKRQRRKKLPAYWERIARPEAERKAKLLPLHNYRKLRSATLDEMAKWDYFNVPLARIERFLGFGISGRIKRAIGSYSKERPFRLLDLGCGNGRALARLKKMFKHRIKTVGLVLKKTPGEKYKGVDRLLEGDVLEVKPREQYDMIYSHAGPMVPGLFRTTILERVVEWLKPGGTAVIDMMFTPLSGPERKTQENEVKTLLRQNGIEPFKFTKDVLVFKKPLRKLPK